MWRALTRDDLLTALNAEETAAYESVVLDAGQADLVAEVLEQVTDQVRSRIAACRDNAVGPAGTLPDGLVFDVMPLVVYRLLSRLGMPADEVRKDEWKQANAWLKEVAMCRVRVERPTEDGPAEEQGYGGAKIIRKGDRKARREDMKGLL